MCGRYTLTKTGQDLWDFIEGALPPDHKADLSDQRKQLEIWEADRRHYNIVPGSYEPILFNDKGKLQLRKSHWWLLPNWAGGKVRWRISKAGEKTFTWVGERKSHFNSRWDTVTNSGNRYWNGLLDTRRCLVPADGFVEWPDDSLRPKDQDKIPHYFTLRDHHPFFFAGIYDEVPADDGNPFVSYNIITVEPNEMLRALPHHRMPAILTQEAAIRWISPSVRADEAGKLLQPTSDDRMVARPISKLVNTPKNESPAVLEPLGSHG